jgi:hypothetical protein
MLPDIFCKAVSREVINRIEKLSSQTQPVWGKMNVAQMLAHCCVSYEYIYENKYKPPGFLMKLILKNMVKKIVVNESPYKRNNRTAPDFLITDERDFEIEKERLIAYILKTQELGKSYFKGKESHSFGKLSCTEWNNMFYKHLDHHLTQFGV